MSKSPILFFLLLLLVGTVCNSMAVSFVGFYIIDGLGQEPWSISDYTGCFALVVILANRTIATRIDGGANPFPLIGLAAIGYFLAALALSIAPGFLTVLSAGVVGFGIGSSSLSTMFSVGGVLADRIGMKRSTFNAYMRATTSTSWMIGPALSFTVADQFGAQAVFKAAITIAVFWLCLWWWTAPRDAVVEPKPHLPTENASGAANTRLRMAILFVFCLALAHSLTFSALPIFFVQEAGLPGFSPGAAFSLKTLVELVAIFSTPFLIARFGIHASLMGTALLAFIAILVLATVTSFLHMLIGAGLEGIYFGLFSTLAISFVQSFSKDRPAYATAMYWNTMMVTLVVAGPAAGLIAQTSDFRTVIFVASAWAIASAAVLSWSIRQNKVET